MNLDFSIIIPTYRRPGRLEACLRALARQDYPLQQFEVIVADDGGGGIEKLRDFGARSFPFCTFLSQPRSGPASARNLGARTATGRFLAFTDDDCEPAPEWLSALALTLGSQPDALVGGRTINSLRANRCSAASQLLVDYLYRAYPEQSTARFFCSNNFALARETFGTLGGFDPTFQIAGGEDRDFCSRWVSRGYPLAYSPTAIVQHAHSLTLAGFWNQHFRYGMGAFQLRRRMLETGRPPLRLQAPGFYLRLLSYPFRETREHRVALATLFALSQVANACGFAREALGRSGAVRS